MVETLQGSSPGILTGYFYIHIWAGILKGVGYKMLKTSCTSLSIFVCTMWTYWVNLMTPNLMKAVSFSIRLNIAKSAIELQSTRFKKFKNVKIDTFITSLMCHFEFVTTCCIYKTELIIQLLLLLLLLLLMCQNYFRFKTSQELVESIFRSRGRRHKMPWKCFDKIVALNFLSSAHAKAEEGF